MAKYSPIQLKQNRMISSDTINEENEEKKKNEEKIVDKIMESLMTCLEQLSNHGELGNEGILQFVDESSYFFTRKYMENTKRISPDADKFCRILVNSLLSSKFPVLDAISFYKDMSEIAREKIDDQYEVKGRQLIDVIHRIFAALPPLFGSMLLLQTSSDVSSSDSSEPSQKEYDFQVLSVVRNSGIKPFFQHPRTANMIDNLFNSKILNPEYQQSSIYPEMKFMQNVYLAAFNPSNFSHVSFFSPLMSTSVRFWCLLVSLILTFCAGLYPANDALVWIALISVGGSCTVEEVQQISSHGAGNYFNSSWNLIDFSIAVSMIGAFISRLVYNSSSESMIFWVHKLFVVVACIFLCFRLLSSFRSSRKLGPLVHIFGRMFLDLLTFLLLTGVITIGFTLAMTVLLSDYISEIGSGSYDSFSLSFLTLSYAMIGNISIDSFSNIDSDFVFVVVHIIYMLFLIITSIMLVNFLIAIMSKTFDSIYEDSQTDQKFLKATIVHECYIDNSSLPPPFTIIAEVINQSVLLLWRLFRKNPDNSSVWTCQHCHHQNKIKEEIKCQNKAETKDEIKDEQNDYEKHEIKEEENFTVGDAAFRILMSNPKSSKVNISDNLRARDNAQTTSLQTIFGSFSLKTHEILEEKDIELGTSAPDDGVFHDEKCLESSTDEDNIHHSHQYDTSSTITRRSFHNIKQNLLLFNEKQQACNECFNPKKETNNDDYCRSIISRFLWGILISPFWSPFIGLLIYFIYYRATSLKSNDNSKSSKEQEDTQRVAEKALSLKLDEERLRAMWLKNFIPQEPLSLSELGKQLEDLVNYELDIMKKDIESIKQASSKSSEFFEKNSKQLEGFSKKVESQLAEILSRLEHIKQ